MPSPLPALNDYVRRLARREVRGETSRTKKASAQHRRDIAALKRQIKQLATQVSKFSKLIPHPAPLASATAPAEKLRLRVDGLKRHRERLGLSAKDFGRLIGVSALTVYNWESGKSKPRRKQLPSIAAIRGIGKREAMARLGANNA